MKPQTPQKHIRIEHGAESEPWSVRIGRQLKAARKAAGLSLATVAEVAGCDPKTPGALERGAGTLGSLESILGALRQLGALDDYRLTLLRRLSASELGQ